MCVYYRLGIHVVVIVYIVAGQSLTIMQSISFVVVVYVTWQQCCQLVRFCLITGKSDFQAFVGWSDRFYGKPADFLMYTFLATCI